MLFLRSMYCLLSCLHYRLGTLLEKKKRMPIPVCEKALF